MPHMVKPKQRPPPRRNGKDDPLCSPNRHRGAGCRPPGPLHLGGPRARCRAGHCAPGGGPGDATQGPTLGAEGRGQVEVTTPLVSGSVLADVQQKGYPARERVPPGGARSAGTARDARDARVATCVRGARNARNARVARNAWDSRNGRDARTTSDSNALRAPRPSANLCDSNALRAPGTSANLFECNEGTGPECKSFRLGCTEGTWPECIIPATAESAIMPGPGHSL
eukprot:gene14990-biopygen6632